VRSDLIQVFKLENVYIFKKARHGKFFYTTNDSVAIPTFNFFALIKFMLERGLIDIKALQGVVDEFNDRTY